jgi:hypothetical protein
MDVVCQLHILWHDGDMFCMHGAQVGILKHANKVSLGCFLQKSKLPYFGIAGQFCALA